MSRVCVRPYIIPIRAKNRAVIRPWLSICSIAPVIAVVLSISSANSTMPQCDTDEYALIYLRSVWTQAEKAPYTMLIPVRIMNIQASSLAA